MSVRPQVHQFVCSVLFTNGEYGRFEGEKSLIEIKINDDEVVASDVPPRYLFPQKRAYSSHDKKTWDKHRDGRIDGRTDTLILMHSRF